MSTNEDSVRKRKLKVVHDENDRYDGKSHRRKYVFAPRDTLSKTAPAHNKEVILKDADPNVLINENRIVEEADYLFPANIGSSQNGGEERVVWEPASNRKKRAEMAARYQELSEQRSSSLPSSPLADRTFPEAILPNHALDPALSSMVKKYNSSVELLPSPGVGRSKSDLGATPLSKIRTGFGSKRSSSKQDTTNDGTPLSIQLYRSLGPNSKTPYSLKYQDSQKTPCANSTPLAAREPKKSEMLLDDLEDMFGDSFEEQSFANELEAKSAPELENVDISVDGEFSDLDMDELDEIMGVNPSAAQNEVNLTPQQKADSRDEDDLLDDDDDDAYDELFGQLAVSKTGPNELATTETNLAKSALQKDSLYRFVIKKASRSFYNIDGKQKEQVDLTVMDSSMRMRRVHVRDFWAELDFEENDVIHVIGTMTGVVDKTQNILIWNPDELLSATTISETLRCQRKSVIKSRISFPGEANIPIIVGHSIHSIFQSCLLTGNTSDGFMYSEMENLLDQFEIAILSADHTKEYVRDQLKEHIPFVKQWVDHNLNRTNGLKPPPFGISKVVDVEEIIWSPEYGIKGYIDVVLEAKLGSGKNSIIPMEIKTGKDHISHRAQVSLYQLLIKDRYDEDPDFSLLVFTKTAETLTNEKNLSDLKMLINLRNKLSKYHKANSRDLPPLAKSISCERCEVKDACMVFNKLMEFGTESEAGLPNGEYTDITGHLNLPAHSEFFNKWDDLLSKEESLFARMKKDLWLYSSTERENSGGNCVGNLVISSRYETSESGDAYYYRFERKYGPDLLSSPFTKMDMVLLSGEDSRFAIATAFVDSVSTNSLVLRMSKQLPTRSLSKPSTQSQSSLSTNKVFAVPEELQIRKYRIDKDVIGHGFSMARFNIMNLFLPDGDQKRRQVVVEGFKPRFMNKPLKYDSALKAAFNEDQVKAMDKVLSAEDYCLVLGMPGTGKTTVIAQIIRSLARNGKTILLASYTHSAVDNILMKLLDDDIDILRVGNPHKFHPSISKFALNSSAIQKPKEYREALLQPQVVAVTCLGLNDAVFSHRQQFDYCIIDEASQVSLPVCIGPLRFCDKFVLFGDHFQLQPLVMSPEAKKGGLEDSLFRLLNDRHPESVVELTYQYRMCSEIMLICNTLIYNGLLKCGNSDVANQVFKIPSKQNLARLIPRTEGTSMWMDHVFEEKNKVIFLDHDKVPAVEVASGDKIENLTEASLIIQIVQAMLACDVEESSIGVMSFYRAQMKHFKMAFSDNKAIDILTADQFQGRDKDCVIISLVRSNENNNAGDLLKEWRRINVAMTRAQSKLIVVGSGKMMRSIEKFGEFMKLMESKSWIYELPIGADKTYRGLGDKFQSPSRKIRTVRRPMVSPDSRAVRNSTVMKDIAGSL